MNEKINIVSVNKFSWSASEFYKSHTFFTGGCSHAGADTQRGILFITMSVNVNTGMVDYYHAY